MFNISYETWNSTCNMYFSLGRGTKKAYLQWFPFSKLTEQDEELIKSSEFHNKYIKNGTFVLFPQAMHRSENYIQKEDGSFRDALLVSPILYLVLQCIGKEISYHYKEERQANITAYYAGHYEDSHSNYKQEYDKFFKHVNVCIDQHQYFIKTDVTNFYNNISLNRLMKRIDEVCNAKETKIQQVHLHLYKELLSYCGAGRFPLIENSMASSYLATIVYMDSIDCEIAEFIKNKVENVSDFEIIRYVDDMYIIFSSPQQLGNLNDTYNRILKQYSSILKRYGLSLNAKKCCIKKAFEINEELKKSLYNEYFNGQKHNIDEHFSGSLQQFLKDVCDKLAKDGLDNTEYVNLINRHFYNESLEFTPSEVYNYLVYESESELKCDEITTLLIKIINLDLSFLSLDPKRLSVMVMKSGSDKAIKAMLNRLFTRYRENIWNSYDTAIAISYLTRSKFNHIDLLSVIKEYCPELYDYYNYNCRYKFLSVLRNDCVESIRRNISEDYKSMILYFLYWVEKDKGNVLSSFAYFKTFFDRVSADLACNSCVNLRGKNKPNYKGYYREKDFKELYESIDNSNDIIKKAHLLRNANPLAHSSAGLLDNNSTSEEINQSIYELNQLVIEYIRYNEL